MLLAQVYAPVERAADVAAIFTQQEHVQRVTRLGRTADSRFELIGAELDAQAVDAVISCLQRVGIATADITIQQVTALRAVDTSVGHSWLGPDPEDFVWAHLVVQARRSARLFARYLTLMAVAGVLAAFGVIGHNPILIVGAMAVSPDLLPICGACVGLVGKRMRLFLRALATLGIGLVVAALAAALLVALLRGIGKIEPHAVGDGGLGALTTVNYATVGIALAASVAAILSFETNASTAVGVAISVTTIPAAAYMGVVFAAGTNVPRAIGAVDVLLLNIALLLAGGSATLSIQRGLRAREAHSGSSTTRDASRQTG
jgi:uncharacterized hydrophobic protein (TIGR00271 family)